ncbi:glycosyltransferase family 4 protein [Peribacillus sp. FSL E2-0159]|uniref:glycosyltransferase family 4 protein n=1 Tax=Peribacillus sp. FSL E2-0159 TaxID=2975289 RepID=UPI00315AB267
MKKVLILANHLDWVYSLRKELIEELNKSYKVVLCVPVSGAEFKLKYFKDMGVEIEFINYQRRGKNPLNELILFAKYYKLIKKINPDIILTYTIKPNIYGAYAAKKLKKPVIMNITGVGTSLTTSKLKHIVINLYKFACKDVNTIFFQNQENFRVFISQKIFHPDKAILIPGSGVNITRFTPQKKIGDDNKIKFLFIGRVMKEKGIDEYLEAAGNLTEKYPNIEFQVLGLIEEENYKNIISNNKRINYLGVSNDVRNEIREADCIVNPSYHEGMSNVLLESAAMGKPLIASNISGCKEIVEDGYNGYLFEVKSVSSLEEKLIQFLGLDSKEKEEMGGKSRRKIEVEFNRVKIIDEYLRAIENILTR